MNLIEASANPTSAGPAAGAANTLRRFHFWLGAALSIALVLIFIVQVAWAKMLITPWYLPVGGTLCALIVLFAIGRPRRWVRLGVALVCVMVACLEWYFVLALTVLPAYTGPIHGGSAVPMFHADLADGTEIDPSYFQQGRPTALVFFQGRWCPFCMTQLQELESHHADFTRVGANVVVVSIEDPDAAAQTQRDFPHLVVVSDQRQELAGAIDIINRASAPGGGDSAAPTILLIDRQGTVQSLYRPVRFIARPSAAELVTTIEGQLAH